MEPVTEVEKLYELIDDMAVTIQTHTDKTYLDALAEAGENIFQYSIIQTLPEKEKERLQSKLENELPGEMKKEGIRKAFQLAVIKGMKEAVQPHHAMTPDAVAMFMGYLVNKLTASRESLALLDPAAGTANLLSAVLNQSSQEAVAYGAEVDETLLNIAYVLSNLQEHDVELFHQDSIEQLASPPVDAVVSDLPVGYYPKDDVAQSFELQAKSGHSYVHHLLIEKSMNHLKEGGFLVLLIPNFMFESEEAPRLHEYIKEEAVILGLLQLPSTMFTSEQFGKSIWLLQKKGPGVVQPGQALLAELPSFSKQDALLDMMKQMDKWFQEQGFDSSL
ncbi:site-specific DNA-methyltransferase (adenine-specific) [Alteribacillus persepolensis]|uniref:Site-specific DNA-methyltransferase (Adenine-specific) n=1 Tax=Alteribacillus persepolensis TaxID=568899 RepID=A0A1G8BG31_9BACI|nr:class I SAM-dependent methyltransferase [Alteribacillus persepolensis]SDH32206.1 site-specific DNA-methyltransferase (adenine-specific) [Alteribacillus persepolensis]